MAPDPFEERKKQLDNILDRLNSQAKEAEGRGNFGAAQAFKNKLTKLEAKGATTVPRTGLGKALRRTAVNLNNWGRGTTTGDASGYENDAPGGSAPLRPAAPEHKESFDEENGETGETGAPGDTGQNDGSNGGNAAEETPFGQPVDEGAAGAGQAQQNGPRPEPITKTGFEEPAAGDTKAPGTEGKTTEAGPNGAALTPAEAASKTPEAAPSAQPQKELPPGGEAIDPKSLKGRLNAAKEKVGEGAKKIGETRDQVNQLKEKFSVKNAVQKAQAEIKKRVKQAIVQAAKQAAIWLANIINIVVGLLGGWEIILIVVAIVLAVVGIYYVIGFYLKGGPGTTPVQQANPISDQSWISKVLALTGDKDVTDAMSTDFFTKLTTYLGEIKLQTTDTTITSKVDEISAEITKYQTAPSATEGKVLIAKIKELLALFNNNVPQFPEPTSSPLATISGFNPTLHGGTPMRTGAVPGHGTFIENNKGTCDAVNLNIPKNATADQLVAHAVFGGTVTRVGGSGIKQYVIIEKQVASGGTYKSLYAHIIPNVTRGQTVSSGAEIGTVVTSIGHLHFELAYNGRCVVTTPLDVANQKQTNDRAFGAYLWDTMKKILKL